MKVNKRERVKSKRKKHNQHIVESKFRKILIDRKSNGNENGNSWREKTETIKTAMNETSWNGKEQKNHDVYNDSSELKKA